MQYAAIAYCQKIYDSIEFECGRACGGFVAGTVLLNATSVEKTHGAAFAAVNPTHNEIYIGYRGSENMKNLFQDMNILKDPFETLNNSTQKFKVFVTDQMHRGLARVYNSLRSKMNEIVIATANSYPDYNIVFLGHSMGGAFATLGALDLYESHGMEERISVFAYGTPRFANVALARHINNLPFRDRMYRIVQRGDPIVHMPSRKYGYEHPRGQISILKTGELYHCSCVDGTGESPDCMNDILELDINRHTNYYGFGSICKYPGPNKL